MPIVQFEQNSLVSTAWKNGGGNTREIARVPAESSMDTFDWRASIAEIAADGPFSSFAGVDRVLVLVGGDGVRLRSIDGSIDHHLSEPLIPFAFPGETSIDASMIGGASRDFNVMTRRATTAADVRVAVASEMLAACSAGVLFAARGSWRVHSAEGDSRAFLLNANNGLWWDGVSLAWELTPLASGGALIAVCVQAAATPGF